MSLLLPIAAWVWPGSRKYRWVGGAGGGLRGRGMREVPAEIWGREGHLPPAVNWYMEPVVLCTEVVTQ